jgi:hypothetical protein
VYTGAPYYGSPALWSPRTWYAGKPPEQVPEVCLLNSGTTNYTMSAIVNATIDRVKRAKIDGQFQSFNVEGDAQGWTTRVNITDYDVFDGYFWGTTATMDAYVSKNYPGITGSNLPVIELAMGVNSGTTAQFHFQVDGDSAWHGPIEFSVTPDAEIHVYELDMSSNPTWMNTSINRIKALRLTPSTTPNAAFAIDYIWIHPRF